MSEHVCRIGVFYDGSYFCKAQRHYWHERKLGWLQLEKFHSLLERHIASAEGSYSAHKIVYAAWFQGVHTAKSSDVEQLRRDREQHHDLMRAKVTPHFLPMGARSSREKGVDVEFALDAYGAVRDGIIDVAALVTGDGDMVPLARRITKHGVRPLVAHFGYAGKKDRGFVNERLRREGWYVLDISALEKRAETQKDFKALFRAFSTRRSSAAGARTGESRGNVLQ